MIAHLRKGETCRDLAEGFGIGTSTVYRYLRPFYSGKHKVHGLNVQVITDPAGGLIWASPALPGARHDMGAAREHGIIDAITAAGVRTVADTAYEGGGAAIRVPPRRRRLDPDTGRYRRLSATQRGSTPRTPTNAGRVSGPTPKLKSWKILREIPSSPSRATTLVRAVQTLIVVG